MSRHIDYAFKAYVLKEHNDLIRSIKKASMLDYAMTSFNTSGIITYTYKNNDGKDTQIVRNECFENGLHKEYFEALKIIRANNVRTYRLRKRINDILSNYRSVFLTFTFTDDTLSNTTAKKRRLLVSRYLKRYNSPYVANIDFGDEHEREHYHAVLGVDKVDFTAWHKYGAIKVKRVRLSDLDNSKTRLSKYVCKLTNHAIKETTKRCALMYSR